MAVWCWLLALTGVKEVATWRFTWVVVAAAAKMTRYLIHSLIISSVAIVPFHIHSPRQTRVYL